MIPCDWSVWDQPWISRHWKFGVRLSDESHNDRPLTTLAVEDVRSHFDLEGAFGRFRSQLMDHLPFKITTGRRKPMGFATA
jgi:hypothetical protein